MDNLLKSKKSVPMFDKGLESTDTVSKKNKAYLNKKSEKFVV